MLVRDTKMGKTRWDGAEMASIEYYVTSSGEIVDASTAAVPEREQWYGPYGAAQARDVSKAVAAGRIAPDRHVAAHQAAAAGNGAAFAPAPEVFPDSPVPGAVAKNAVLYAILGLLIPGLPSLLMREDKVVGGIQLGIWVLSWILTLVLIGFLLWPAVAIWSAVTGYGDAQLWNRRHGFVT